MKNLLRRIRRNDIEATLGNAQLKVAGAAVGGGGVLAFIWKVLRGHI